MIPGLLSSLEKQKAAQKKAPVKREFTSAASGLTYQWGGEGEPTQADFDKILAADNEYLAQQEKAKAPVDYVKQAKDQAKLRTMRADTAKAQAEAASGVGGTAMWASSELAKLSKEAKKALAPLDKIIQQAGQTTLRKVALGPIVGGLPQSGQDAVVEVLPSQVRDPIKATLGAQKQTKASEFITGPLDAVSRGIADPKQELYQQFGVAFDPKARPEERIGAGVNMVGVLLGVGMKGKSISQALKKMPVGPEYYALMKKRGIGRAEASKIYKDLQGLADMEVRITAPATSGKPKVTETPKADQSSPTFKQADSATVETEAGYAGQPKPKDLTGFKKPSDEIRKAQAEPELKAYREKYGATAPVVPERVSLSAYIEANYKARQQGLLNAIRNSPTGAFSKALGGAGIKETKAARAKLIAELERDIASGKVNAQVAKELEDTWNKANPKGGVTPKPNPPTAPGVAATQAADVAEAAKPKPKRRASATKKQAQPTTATEPATSTTTATPQPGATKPPVVPTTANQGTQAEQSKAGVATAVATAPTEAQATVVPPPVPAGAKTAAAAQGPKTAGNNASINRRRIFEGRPEIESGSGTVADRTFDPKDYDYNDFQESLRQRSKQEKPAPFDKAQQEAWTYHREQLEARQAELNAKVDAGDTSPATRAAIDALDDDINIADKMGVEAGTIGSLAFSARRSNPFDYSPANIKFKAYKFNGKEKLSPETSKKLSDLLKEEKKLADTASGATKFTEAEAKEAAAYITSVGKGIKKAATAQQRAQALDAFREGIRSLMNKASLGLDPMDLVTMAPRIRNLARAWVAPGSKLDDVVDGILADAEMIAKQDPKLSQVLLKPDGSLLLDREDIIRVLASKERDGVRALRDNIDIDLEAKRFEIDTLMNDIKDSAEYRSLNKVQRGLREFSGLSRGIQAGFDLSAAGNQGLQALASNPRASVKAFRNMLSAAKSEKNLQRVMGELRSQPNYKLAVASKLKVNATHVSSDEIGFAQGVLGRLPGLGASNRAYAAYLNTLRMEAFNDMVKAVEKKGSKISVSDADELSEFINTMTGAGTGDFANALAVINKKTQNALFFAPGYRVARGKYTLGTPMWNAINSARKTGDYRVVKEIGKRYGATLAAYGTIYGLLAANGTKTDFNPASKNFMKVRLPGSNAYVDPTGGLLSFVRFAARATMPNPEFDKVTGEPKRGEFGEQKTREPNPAIALGYYLAGAFGPIPSAAGRAVTKKAFGKSYDYTKPEGRENMVWAVAPIWIQQARDIQSDPKLTPAQKSMLTMATFFGASVDVQEKEVPRL